MYNLDLGDNLLTGNIPLELFELIGLGVMYLDYNYLSGEIPEEVGDLINLENLYLDNDELNGQIPEIICNIYDGLYSFSIFNNQLCPPYPECNDVVITNEDEQDTSDCDTF